MVYLVDDDVDDLELVQEALLSNSYEGPIATMRNGRLLLDKLYNAADALPDVIILDLNMPLIDGFTALKEIRDHARFKSIPVIILTASARKEDESRCFQLGCNFFFSKPVTLGDYAPIVSTVKNLMERRA